MATKTKPKRKASKTWNPLPGRLPRVNDDVLWSFLYSGWPIVIQGYLVDDREWVYLADQTQEPLELMTHWRRLPDPPAPPAKARPAAAKGRKRRTK